MKKILIVDDNQQNLYMLDVLLETNGYQVISAQNGRDALQQAVQQQPDLIVSDILMPDMDGFSLCRAWKSDANLKQIPFVFFTGTYTDPKDQAFAEQLGADGFLIKPMPPAQLLQSLQTILNENPGVDGQSTPKDSRETDVNYKEYSQVLIRKLEDKMVQLNQANKRIRSLYQASRELVTMKPHGVMIHNILTAMVQMAGYQQTNYFVYNPRDRRLHLLDAVGFSEGTLTVFRDELVFSLGEKRGLVGWVAQERVTYNIADTAEEEHWITLDDSIRSALLTPVYFNETLFGVMTLFSQEPHAFKEDDEQNLAALANSMALTFETRKAEEEIYHLNTQLEKRVADRTAQLQASNRDLEAFAHSVSHHLRVPLRALEGYSRVLDQEYRQKLGEEGSHIVDIIRANALKMDQIINDLLKISRVSTGEITLVQLEMRKLIYTVFQETALPEEQNAIDLQCGELLNAFGDPIMVRQIWTSLLATAVRCSLKMPAPSIRIDAYREDNMVVYQLRSQSSELDAEEINQLLGMHQWDLLLDAGETCRMELAIAQRIVDRHHGRIWADDCPDWGICLSFSLPAPLGT